MIRKITLVVCFISLVFELKAQFVNRLEIVPTYTHTLYDMSMTLHDRGITVSQKSRSQAGTASLNLRYRLNQRYHVGYTFGYYFFGNSQFTNTYGAVTHSMDQELGGFSNSVGLYLYPIRQQNKFRPYIYAGLVHQDVRLTRGEVDYRFEVPNGSQEELPTTVAWSHPAYSGPIGGFGGELLIGFNYLEDERFGYVFSVGSGAIYQQHNPYIPKLIYVPRAQVGVVFRMLKTKMPL